ncbi:MAG: ABC transporter substrate-binding protein, partial [Promethearchaeota archaeon]
MIKNKKIERTISIIVLVTLFTLIFASKFAISDTQTSTTFYYGILGAPYELDCHKWQDSKSLSVVDQVCEGLFANNLSDPGSYIVPRLALDDGVWSSDGKTFNVSLREGVWFHDGTPFNAQAVKWNFDRLENLINQG